MSCLFCDLNNNQKEIIYQNDLVYCVFDKFPVNKGHVLIITKRHINDYFALKEKELLAIDQALKFCKELIDQKYHPSGYNIGINNGKSAGQTIMHLHVHLLPRYENDCENPRGGVRGVIPGKQSY